MPSSNQLDHAEHSHSVHPSRRHRLQPASKLLLPILHGVTSDQLPAAAAALRSSSPAGRHLTVQRRDACRGATWNGASSIPGRYASLSRQLGEVARIWALASSAKHGRLVCSRYSRTSSPSASAEPCPEAEGFDCFQRSPMSNPRSHISSSFVVWTPTLSPHIATTAGPETVGPAPPRRGLGRGVGRGARGADLRPGRPVPEICAPRPAPPCAPE